MIKTVSKVFDAFNINNMNYTSQRTTGGCFLEIVYLSLSKQRISKLYKLVSFINL